MTAPGPDTDGLADARVRTAQLRRIRRLDDAERVARQALASWPDDAGLLCELAAVLLAAERWAEALPVADTAVAADPPGERGHRLRGLLLSMTDRHQEALAAAWVAVTLAPEEPCTGIAYTRVLQRAGRVRDAAQAAHRVVTLAPSSADAHYLLADVAGDLGDLPTARRAYEETLRLAPEHAAARHDLAVLDANARRPGRALRGLIDAGRLAPAMTQVRSTVVAVLWQLSGRTRLWFVLATIAVLMTADNPSAARIVGGVVLALTGLLGWWTLRGLPRGSWPVLAATLRTDRPLTVVHAVLAVCLLVLVAVVVTGVGALAILVWFALIVLGLLTIVVRLARRRRRTRR
ncbi:tetratricopeptide repeat protein [Pseudonocardia sp. N23]|uniref:tetratricopeptide repeat protein n=1 Tax=Pseudonocardia sp. N23 TaxID=1987376 RepID=UPI000BFE9F49|nr:tetratricopeptide repeat protein [Pseudonocardia sp. N23]GAY11039.1 TPR-repeat-containing protein [Pseudonocardia sp. N23]